MAKIIGGTVATPMKVADLAQNNPLKADYVKGKHLVANSIKCSASGNPIRLDEVSPLEHEIAVGVKSKNLYFATADKTYTFVGLTETVKKGLSSFVLNGTTTMDGSMQIASGVPLKAGTYTVSVFGTNVTKAGDTDRIYVAYTDASGATKYCNYILDGSPKTFTIVNDQEVSVQFIFASGSVYENKEVSIQIEEGTTATAYTPYIDVNGASVQRCGKNLFHNTQTTSHWLGGAEIKATKDLSSVVINGTVGNTASTAICQNLPIKAGTYAISVYGVNVITETADRLYIQYKKADGTSSVIAHTIMPNKSQSFVVAEDGFIDVCMVGASTSVYNNKEVSVQIELGKTATYYEPYKCEPHTADANGVVNGIIGNGEDVTLMGDGVTITAEYNVDTKKYIDKKFAELQALVLEV